MKHLLYFLAIIATACHSLPKEHRQTIDLAGNWQFALDSANLGVAERWHMTELNDSVTLPGTLDINQKGLKNNDTTTMHLNRRYVYEGPAWYRKKVVIPQQFNSKQLSIVLERTKATTVWVDDQLVGQSILLQSEQRFDASRNLTPGEHTITIRVDNNRKLTPYGGVHIYADDTQTNWNGIIGKMAIEATSKTYIDNLQVTPDIDTKKISIQMGINNQLNAKDLSIKLLIKQTNDGKTVILKPLTTQSPCDTLITLEYVLGDDMLLWDDYHQPLYELTAVIEGQGFADSKTVPFGMRQFGTQGTQFTINGRTTFLRGKHEACVFPLTGHPPMDVDGWVRVFRIAKSYGINHYRFHSYCPPEAAFTAADKEGIFLQAELPFWGGLDSDSVALMQRQEGIAMLKSYANHPSFVMFSHGNEIWSGHDRVEKNIVALKAYDNRPLYTMGSNNSIGYEAPRACSDFFVAARTPSAGDTTLTHTRLTHAFADSHQGGILNTQTPSTNVNFAHAVSQINIPVVSHEIGQYQIYPDYREIGKYTGVVEARNLMVFKNRLEKAGMMNQNIDFQKASGAWSALCYKAEMEAALRTSGMAGFQLLDLQDFPGQGTALVGILDAFMDSKNVVSADVWKQSCNDATLLLQFHKYCWQNTETFEAVAMVANYSNKTLTDDLLWEARDGQGNKLFESFIEKVEMPMGKLSNVGTIKFPCHSFPVPEKVTLSIRLKNSQYSNSYPLWVYPSPDKPIEDKGIVMASSLNTAILAKLKAGGKVLLIPKNIEKKGYTVGGLFPPEFWNYGMFKGISEWAKKPVSPGTLGILTNPAHPMFRAFPTDTHTNWQWFSIVKASQPLILDGTDASYRPIVQVIDNLERNHKLGLVFEFKVGAGKLLVCMAQLDKTRDQPEAQQLLRSMVNYMQSDAFMPSYEMPIEMEKWFNN